MVMAQKQSRARVRRSVNTSHSMHRPKTRRPRLVVLPGGASQRRGRPRVKAKPASRRSPARGSLKPVRQMFITARRATGRIGRAGSKTGVTSLVRVGPSVVGLRVFVITGLVVMTFIFGLVMLHILLAQSSFRLEELHGRVTEEEARYREMRREIASSESPARIAEAARSIGMVPPRDRRYITLETLGSGNPEFASRDGLKAILGKQP